MSFLIEWLFEEVFQGLGEWVWSTTWGKPILLAAGTMLAGLVVNAVILAFGSA